MRQVTGELLINTQSSLEASSVTQEEDYRFRITIIAPRKGEMDDIVDLVYSAIHGSTPLYDYTNYPSISQVGTIRFTGATLISRPPIMIESQKHHVTEIIVELISEHDVSIYPVGENYFPIAPRSSPVGIDRGEEPL